MNTRMWLAVVLLGLCARRTPALELAVSSDTLDVEKSIETVRRDESAKPILDSIFDGWRGGTAVAFAASAPRALRSALARPSLAPALAKGLRIPAVPAAQADRSPQKQCCLDTLEITPDGTAFRLRSTRNGWKFWEPINVVEESTPGRDGVTFNKKGEFVGSWKQDMKTRANLYQAVQSADGRHQIYTIEGKGIDSAEISRNGKVVADVQGKFKIGADDKIYTLKSDDKGEEVVSIDPITRKQTTVAKTTAKFKQWDEVVPEQGHWDTKGHFVTVPGKAGYTETVKGAPGYTETIKGKAGYYETIKGKPGYYETIVDQAGYYQRVPGTPGYYETIPGTPGYYQRVPGTPGYYQTIPGTPGYYETIPGTPGYYEHHGGTSGYYDSDGYWVDGDSGYDEWVPGSPDTQVWHGGSPDTQVWHDGTPDAQVWHDGTPDAQVWVPPVTHQLWNDGTPDTQLWHDPVPDKQVWHDPVPDKQVWHDPVPDSQQWVQDSKTWVVDSPKHTETKTGDRIPIQDLEVNSKGEVYGLQGGDVTDLTTQTQLTQSGGNTTDFKVDGRGDVYSVTDKGVSLNGQKQAIGVDGPFGIDDSGNVYRASDGVIDRIAAVATPTDAGAGAAGK